MELLYFYGIISQSSEHNNDFVDDDLVSRQRTRQARRKLSLFSQHTRKVSIKYYEIIMLSDVLCFLLLFLLLPSTMAFTESLKRNEK